MIKLVNDTISHEDIDSLCDWLKTYPRLTKGDLTIQFEKEYSKWIGRKYSVFVNSGSSSNLLMVYYLKLQNLKNDRVVIPALSWATTVAPFIQFGFKILLCDANMDNLGVRLDKLEEIFSVYSPAAFINVHALGFASSIDQVNELCEKYGVLLIVDSCETMGTTHKGKKVGSEGLMSSFSEFYGHISSTVEGGIICTDDPKVYETLLMLRSHGWSRDISKKRQEELRKKNNISEFDSMYSFFLPGFNVRSTDLQAYIGLLQMKKLDSFIEKRHNNFKLYDSLIGRYNVINIPKNETISNFAYPFVRDKRNKIVKALIENEVETRPLICGSMSLQPFTQPYIKHNPLATPVCDDTLHRFGFYLPNNPDITEDEVKFICKIVKDNL